MDDYGQSTRLLAATTLRYKCTGYATDVDFPTGFKPFFKSLFKPFSNWVTN